MSSMKDALREEIFRIKKLAALIDEDPRMEETIRKFASDHFANGIGPSANGRSRARASRNTETPGTGLLAKAIEFVEQKGPANRQEILNATGMAGGSFSHFIRDSGKFNQREDGKWELKK